MSRAHVQGGAAELGNVTDAQAGVQQPVHQGAGAVANVGCLGWVITGYLVARGNHAADLITLKGQGTGRRLLRHTHAAGGVVVNPFTVNAPAKEGAKESDFLPLGTGLNCHRIAAGNKPGARLPEAIKRGDINGGQREGATERGEMREQVDVEIERGFGKAPRGAVRKEGIGSRGEGDAGGKGSVRVSARFQDGEAAKGALPVVCTEGSAQFVAISPDRAGAEGVRLALSPVLTIPEVAAVGGQLHDPNIHVSCTRILYMGCFVF